MSVSGGLGRVGDGLVEGWAWDLQDPLARLRVAIVLDGDIVAFGRADRASPSPARAKAEEAPACGFSCEVPKTRLHTARLLSVMAETSSGFTLLIERTLGGEPAFAPARGPALHFDITDLLEFLVHHREVSGIQRVQCGYLANALAAPGEGFAIRVCAQPRGAHRYVEIGRDTIEAILAGIEGRRAMSDAAWRRYIETARLGAGTEPDFRRGDIILTTGAPWVYEEYYRAIRQAKHEHGVRYFQISYDLIPVVQPETAALGIIGGFTRSIAGMLECADHILAISRHTQRDLLQTCLALGMSCPPVTVIPMGATLTYLDDAMPEPATATDEEPSPRELFGDYVLCVGTIEPRKNHAYLHAIWKRMLEKRTQPGAVPKLVCVGRMGWHMESFERLLKASNHLDGHFVHLTEIGDAMLARLYQDCLFTVFPSLYEGWGLPVAESLLFSKLCVCSNTSSLPEVGGEWAVYLDPHNVNDGESVIAGLLDDPARIALLERRLREGYRPVTWREATQTLLACVATAHAALSAVAGDGGLVPVGIGRCYSVCSTSVQGGPLRQLAHAIDLGIVQRLLAGPDWHALEPWGCWSCGVVARLEFRLPSHVPLDADRGVPRELTCHLVLRLPGGVGERAVRVVINGVQRGMFTLTDDGDAAVRIPLSGGIGQVVRMELRLDTPIHPERHAADQRLLGLGVRSVSVWNEANEAALLSYFEAQILSV